MKFANATELDRKSGVAQWRDLLFLFRFSRLMYGLKPVPFTAEQSRNLFMPWETVMWRGKRCRTAV